MLAKALRLLRGKGAETTAKDLATAADSIDIETLRTRLESAQRKRAALLLEGKPAQILAAEKDAELARVELERGEAALAELRRRQAEAEATERRQAFEAQYKDVKARRDAAARKVREEYPKLAAAIAELADEEHRADQEVAELVREHLRRYGPEGNERSDLPLLASASQENWSDYVGSPALGQLARLPGLGSFEGLGADLPPNRQAVYALTGQGGPGQLHDGSPRHQFA